MFVEGVVFSSRLPPSIVLVLTSNQASVRPPMIFRADFLVFALNLNHLLPAGQAGAAVDHPSHATSMTGHFLGRPSSTRIAFFFLTKIFLPMSWVDQESRNWES